MGSDLNFLLSTVAVMVALQQPADDHRLPQDDDPVLLALRISSPAGNRLASWFCRRWKRIQSSLR